MKNRNAYDPGHNVSRRMLSRRKFVALGGAVLATAALDGCSSSSTADNTASSGDSASASQTAPSSSETALSPASSEVSSREFQLLSDTQFYFDTVCLINGYMTQEILDGTFERCAFFQDTLSAQQEGTDIDRINKAGGEPVQVQPETADLISKALRYCEESGGLFDITIGAASLLWDFKEGVVPDAQELAEAITHIDYTKVKVDGNTVQLTDPQARLDVGGVAKGYIADSLIAYLQEQGVESGFVNLGGNVKTLGSKPDGSPWSIGIQNPNGGIEEFNNPNDAIAKVDSVGTSVVTSGLYERVFEKDGTRYWHILDPKTGYPVETDLISATIVSDESIDGDGYTKQLFLGDTAAVERFFVEHPEFQGMTVDAQGAIWTSENATIQVYEGV